MKPDHIKDRRRKELRRIHKRYGELVDLNRELGYKKLEKPIRHGWFKEIVITPKVERYRNKKAIFELYEKVEKAYWGRTKEKAQKHWDAQTSDHLIHRGLPTLSKRQFNKLSPKAQALCTPFRYRTKRNKLRTRFYIRFPKGTYKIKFTRAYITHSKRIDPALESEWQILNQQLLKPGYFEANKGMFSYYRWDHKFWTSVKRKKEKRRLNDKIRSLKHHQIADLIKEEVKWEVN